jgi:segregation and condensation protein A
MLSDEELIELMISEPSWEDVLVRIVVEEKMDPWDIDLVKLADVFCEYLHRMKTLDLRIPARFILIAAILLRMKSDIFTQKPKRKVLIPEAPEQQNEEVLRKLAEIPPLEPPIKRIPLRKVTLEELIYALKKAFEIRERREIRKRRIKERVDVLLQVEEEDITERINTLLFHIKKILEELEKEEIEFSKLVDEWKREKIVKTFIPILHLAQEGKVSCEQRELFDEIYIRLRGEENEQESSA